MRLPNAERAIIRPEKLRDYLLSRSHPRGSTKAAFFAEIGYTQDNWPKLEQALREQHLVLDAEELEATEWGRMFAIVGELRGPLGEPATLRSIWFIRKGEETPRFVTAYPATR